MQPEQEYITSITLPTGATTGARIVLDASSDQISVYNSSNKLVAVIGTSNGIIEVMDGSTRFIELSNGQIILGGYNAGNPDLSNAATVGYVNNGTNTYTSITSPNDLINNFLDQGSLLVQAGKPGLGLGGTNMGNPNALVLDEAGSSAMYVGLSGAIQKTDLTGNPYSKVNPSFTGGYTNGNVQVWAGPNDNLMMAGEFSVNSATSGTAGVGTLFTLGGIYVPKKGFTIPTVHRNASSVMYLNNNVCINVHSGTGVVELQWPAVVISAGDKVAFQCDLPLGNLT